MKRVAEIDEALIEILPSGIMHIHVKVEGSFSLKHALNVFRARIDLAEGKPYPIMYTAPKFIRPSKEVRKYMVSVEREKHSLADAFIMNSISHRLLTGMYMRFYKPRIPTALFDSKEEAIDWLLTFKKV